MKFLVTGTRAYGPTSEDSNLDIVLRQKDAQDLACYLIDSDIDIRRITDNNHPLYEGFYFHLFGMQINIIVVQNEEEFNLWKERTEQMQSISPIHDRQERITMFKNFNAR